MTQDDKELLMLASKAAGVEGFWVDSGLNIGSNATPVIWNPLDDDGDALRLAVKLRIDTYFEFDRVMCVGADHLRSPSATEYFYDAPKPTDQLAATRRAITRAAAEIGRAGECS